MLVVRVWFEQPPDGGLRARVTRTLDVTSRDETSTVVSTPGEITSAMVDWLDSVISASSEVTPR